MPDPSAGAEPATVAGSAAAAEPNTVAEPVEVTQPESNAGDANPDAPYDTVVIGAGPGGLSVALNLVRARRRTLVLDSNRPRNAATLHSHGYLTRDGISPLELRKLGQAEIEGYPDGEFQLALAQTITATDGGYTVEARGVRGAPNRTVRTRTVIISTGVVEVMPALPSLRAFYGTSLHSCIECDGYESRDQPLALIGETADLADRAILLSQWSADVIVFTNGVGVVTPDDEALLASRGIPVDRRPIADVDGDRTGLTGIRLQDGTVVPRTAGFLRPVYEPSLAFAADLDLDTNDEGFVTTDAHGRTSRNGIYAAGDSTQPGPQQLIIAAGAGARVAATVNRDLAFAG
ncbi:NAD(P)/FAD-dependent oxidoreductase [Planctomonas psychrotolerans]|uniref:NAD(P)/FAD-dependent oxidoreductase n=1 Tax=Planctomonas psychrotolerans TaxID=2528712 RepID=UPI00123B3056|nr:NAD(P)/FAD-dependent oxidoreductase [Planctomonas psychrotolerans]